MQAPWHPGKAQDFGTYRSGAFETNYIYNKNILLPFNAFARGVVKPITRVGKPCLKAFKGI